jgi:hypothetical protein
MQMIYDTDDSDDFWYRQEDGEDEAYELARLYGEDSEDDETQHPSLTAQERSPSLMKRL